VAALAFTNHDEPVLMSLGRVPLGGAIHLKDFAANSAVTGEIE